MYPLRNMRTNHGLTVTRMTTVQQTSGTVRQEREATMKQAHLFIGELLFSMRDIIAFPQTRYLSLALFIIAILYWRTRDRVRQNARYINRSHCYYFT